MLPLSIPFRRPGCGHSFTGPILVPAEAEAELSPWVPLRRSA